MDEHDYIRITNARLRYYLQIKDHNSLGDDEWVIRLKKLERIRRKEPGN